MHTLMYVGWSRPGSVAYFDAILYSSGALSLLAYKAAVPSMSRPEQETTTIKELQGSGDSHPAVRDLVQKHVEEVLAWQTRKGTQQIPCKYRCDREEHLLAMKFEKLLLRRDKAVGRERSRSRLSPSEVALVNSVPGVPLHGCSSRASCSNSSMVQHLSESGSVGLHHAALRNSVDELGKADAKASTPKDGESLTGVSCSTGSGSDSTSSSSSSSGSSSSSSGSSSGRTQSKNAVSTGKAQKKPAASVSCIKVQKKPMARLPAKARKK